MEEETEKKYENIVKFCRQNHTSFVDYQFPPNDKSLGEGVFKRLYNRFKLTKLIWLRPNQIVTSKNDEDGWSVLKNPQPSDVTQSALVADCAFIAAMIAITERPDIFDKIFPSKEYSPEGVYRVRLYINGEWKTIIVDDYFPCHTQSNEMATGGAKRKQLWVPLIEKALAKHFGSYSVFEAGATAMFAMSMLTGSCCFTLFVPSDPDDFDLFWNIVKSARSSDFLVCCGSKENDFREKKGIVFKHGYTLLDLNDEYKNRLLLLRNPWGKFEHAGKWSKTWDSWPAEMKEKLLIDGVKENGTFWMELDDFMNKFENVTICKIRPNWYEFREDLTIGMDTKTVVITVKETCEASFAAISKKKEYRRPFDDMMISVHRISEEAIVGEMIGRSSNNNVYYTPTEDILLTPGKYIIMIINFENMNKVPIDIVLVCYSSKSISHKLISQNPQMFNQAIRELVLKDGEPKPDVEFGIFLRVCRKKLRVMIYMADNFLKTKNLHISVDCSESENLKSSRGSFKTTDIIPPMSYQILTILTPIDPETPIFRIEKSRIDVTHEKFIGKDITHDRSIASQNLQHYPIIDSLDTVHSTQSIFYNSGSIEVSATRKCQKRIKHLLRKCECRI